MTIPPEVKEESVGTEHKEYSDSQTSVTPVKYVRTVKYSRSVPFTVNHFEIISWSYNDEVTALCLIYIAETELRFHFRFGLKSNVSLMCRIFHIARFRFQSQLPGTGMGSELESGDVNNS